MRCYKHVLHSNIFGSRCVFREVQMKFDFLFIPEKDSTWCKLPFSQAFVHHFNSHELFQMPKVQLNSSPNESSLKYSVSVEKAGAVRSFAAPALVLPCWAVVLISGLSSVVT